MHILAIIFMVIGIIVTVIVLAALGVGLFFASEFDESAWPANAPDPVNEEPEPAPQTFTYVVTLDGEFDLFTVDGVFGDPLQDGGWLRFFNEYGEELARFLCHHIYSVVRKEAA